MSLSTMRARLNGPVDPYAVERKAQRKTRRANRKPTSPAVALVLVALLGLLFTPVFLIGPYVFGCAVVILAVHLSRRNDAHQG